MPRTTGRGYASKMEKLLAGKREQMRKQFFDSFFLPGGWIGATDTYKRTMGEADEFFALEDAAYSLTMRRALPEPGAGEQLVMAGHEVMLSQWFRKPVLRSDVELARYFYSQQSAVHAFPHKAWDKVLESQRGKHLHLPITIWGFPGGQTFLRNVPCMSFEGLGGIVSYVEPAMCRYFWPVIIATKARLMAQATDRDAEFGLRAAMTDNLNLGLLLYRYIGSGGQARLTSSDLAEFMYPELFKSIGTMGHELMCCHQQFGKKLADAEFEAMENFVNRMHKGMLLTDLVDAESIGLENAIRILQLFPDFKEVGIRLDSGDIAAQCVRYYRTMLDKGIDVRTIVFESEVTPDSVREVYDHFRRETGVEPTMLFPGAGGYWWKLVHRDTLSVAFKRTATGLNPNTKFSNDVGKESLAGRLRVYACGHKLVIADVSETIDGVPLFVKLVDNGRIVYDEAFDVQAARALATWGLYTEIEYSPVIAYNMERFRSMREEERQLSLAHLAA